MDVLAKTKKYRKLLLSLPVPSLIFQKSFNYCESKRKHHQILDPHSAKIRDSIK